MDYIIAVRFPTGKIEIISNLDEKFCTEDVALFSTEEDANKAAKDIPICKAYGYQVLEVE